jgi:hypothetical protein
MGTAAPQPLGGPQPHSGLRKWFHDLKAWQRWSLIIVAAFFGLSALGAIVGGGENASNAPTASPSAQQSAAAGPGNTETQTATAPAKPALKLTVANGDRSVYTDTYQLRGTVGVGGHVWVNNARAHVSGLHWLETVRFHGTGDEDVTVTATKHGYESAEATTTLTRKLSAAERAARAAARQRARERAAARRAARAAARQQAASQERALETAQSYLEMSGMSKQGLIEQLSSSAGEGFPMTDAIWAADHVQVDWNREAVEAAKSYLEMSPMSKSALIEQLSSSAGEGFTLAQAQYGADRAY